MWRFGGGDPARLWRGVALGPEPPEPWPSRVEAFMAACAIHAGQRERDVLSALQGLASDG